MTTTTPRKRAARKPRAVVEPVAAPVEEDVAEVVEHEPEPVEALDDALVEDVAEPGPVQYVAVRKLVFGGKTYLAGELVPGAEKITRIETWVSHRYLKLKPADAVKEE